MSALGLQLWWGLSLSCVPDVPRVPGVVVVAQEQQATWIRNFNPLVPTSARWPTSAGVYEPLYIYNQAAGEWV
ncbi:MAG: peptide/nickel transport system substrate-binding protein, partial [Cognaticolwellia sp.]